ncbi:MAG: glycosyltransferase family 4 protein [Deltaproteobacteria bacterium]|nr:glycosyltransferase family 4 protein [Deltaproteobacteria bacterium]
MSIKKIGIVAEYFYPHLGGISDHIFFFSQELLKRGYDVTILTGHQGQENPIKLPEKLRVIRLGKSYPIHSAGSTCKVTLGLGLGKRIRQVLKDEKFDILHLQSPTDVTLQLMFLKYTNTVTIGTLHSYFNFVPYFKVFQKLIQSYIDKLDGIISVSHACIEAMERYFKVQYQIIPNGIDIDFFAQKAPPVEELKSDHKNIFFLARLEPRNGLDCLIEAMPRVLEKVPNARLIVAGDGPLRKSCEKKSGELLGKNIVFVGPIFETRPNYFATSDVFCYPAHHATFGITLLEAMAARKPVVAMDNPGFRQVVTSGVNGILTKMHDSNALADGLIQVLTDEALSQRLVKNGWEHVQNFSWERVTDQILDFYQKTYEKYHAKKLSA